MDIKFLPVFLLLVAITGINSEEIPLTAQPDTEEYVICGQDADFNWQYNTANPVADIKWYQYDEVGNVIIDEIANYNGSIFLLNEGSTFQAAKENRIQYIPNAGIRIKTITYQDEGHIGPEIDFINHDHSSGKTKIIVTVDPSLVVPFEASPTNSVLNDASKVLVCHVNARPTPTIKWYHDGVELSHDGVKHTIAETTATGNCQTTSVESTLTISNLGVADAGNITCSAAVVKDTTVYHDHTTELIVEYKPGTVTPTAVNFSSSNINNGESTTIFCQGFSIPAATYEIWRNGAKIAEGLPDSNGVFNHTIGPVEFYDDGEYTCKAVNAHGFEDVLVRLNVSISPIIWHVTPSPSEIELGSPLNISCGGRADPFADSNMNWTKLHGATNAFTETKSVIHTNDSITFIRNDLSIASVTKNDYGKYQCLAYNDLGMVTRDVWVYIKCPPTITSTTLPQPNAQYNEFDTASFECNVQGYPRPTVEWKNDGVTVADNITETASNVTGVWVINSKIDLVLTREFRGKLECFTTNGLTPNDTESTNIFMDYRPDITLVALEKDVYSLGGSMAFAAAVNDSVILHCSATSYPVSEIRWYKDVVEITTLVIRNETVNNDDIFTYTKTSWISISAIKETDNRDEYRCEATASGLDAISDTIKVLVLNGDFTKKPDEPTCAAIGETAFFEWRYHYTQPFDDIKWEKYEDINGTIDYTLGRLVYPSTISWTDSAKYENDATTNSGFYIKDVQLSDEGYYGIKINFENSAVVFTHIVYLTIVINPHDLVINPAAPTVFENNNVTLTCRVIGKPAPTLSWYRIEDMSNVLVDNGIDYAITFTETPITGNETLVESHLTVLSADNFDLGNYSCKTNNKLTSEFTFKMLDVYYPPRNTNLTSAANPVLESDAVVLTCETDASPEPIYYQIIHEGVFVHNSTDGTFVIDSAMYYHGGNYECVPYNLAGYGDNSTLLLIINVPPVLVDYEDPVNGIVDQSASLYCKFYGNPEPDIYWTKLSGGSGENMIKTDHVYHTNSTIHFEQSSNALTTTIEEDYGVYQCYANNTYGFVFKNITFNVYYAVNITSHTLVQPYDNNTSGTNVVRECIVDGYPEPITVEWYLNNLKVIRHLVTNTKIGETERSVTIKSTLSMNNVDQDDQGVLECRASNSIGSDNESTIFNVLYPPEMTSNPNNIETENLNAILHLTCVAIGNEIPTMAWYKDGVLITHGGMNDISTTIIVATQQTTSTLRVNPVTVEMDGVYSCNATNNLGNDSFVTTVNVLYPPEIIDFPRNTLTATEYARNYVIRCAASGNPRPIITWFQNGTAITFPNPRYTSVINNYNDTTIVHEVTISTVANEDFGNWTCRADNTIANSIQGSDEETTLFTVSYDPVFVASYPEAIYYSNDTNSAVLSCRVKSHPAPTTITWAVPSQDNRYTFVTNTIEVTPQYTIIERVLTISPVNETDFGNFTCTGTNGVDTINTTSELIVYYKGKPDTSQIINLKEGDKLWLSVPSVVSNPISNFTYYFNGTVIMSPDHIIYEYVNSTDVIRTEQGTMLSDNAVDYMNSGIYRIEACNLVGCKVDEWKVIVDYKPVLMTTIPDITHINVTDTLTLECTFLGNDLPGTVVWTNGGNVLSSPAVTITQSIEYAGEFGSSVVSILQLPNVGVPDGKDYACSSTNSEGTTQGTYNVSVCHPPVIVTDLSLTTIRVTEGSSNAFEFVTDSNPIATFEWKKDGSVNNMMTTPGIDDGNLVDPWYTVRQTSDATETTASRNMSGQYEVTACNMLGCVTSQTSTLIIEYPPNIQPIDDQSVVQGENGKFTCVADAEPAPTIQWFFNGTGPLSTNPDYTLSSPVSTVNTYNTEVMSTLTVNDVQRLTDVGVFTCRANNYIGTSNDDSNLLVAYAPIEVTPLQDIYVDEGSTFTLPYNVRAVPEANFTWLFNGTSADPSVYQTTSNINQNTIFDIYTEGSISNSVVLTRAQSGVYTATALNNMGNVSDSANVIVRHAPQLSGLTADTTLTQLDPSPSLICNSEALPVSTITWYKNGVQLTDTPVDNFLITEKLAVNTLFDTTLVSTITFNSLSKTDSANYTCEATNSLGTRSQKTHMIVHYPPVIVPDFPPGVYNVTENTLDRLKCNVDSNPASQYQWFYSLNGVSYTLMSGNIQQQYETVPNPDYEAIFNTSVLFLPNNADKTNAGYYYCTAINYLGTARQDVQLNVFFGPDFIAPGIMNGLEDVTVGSGTQFVCTIECNPESNIIWLKDGSPVAANLYTTIAQPIVNDVSTKESTLTFTNIQTTDHGEYTCQAENTVGVSTQSKVLNVVYPPVTTTLTQNVYVNDGDVVNLNCSATGNPTPAYQWTKQDGTIETGSPLTFTAAIGLDGQYTCVPKNSVGQGTPAVLQLFVSIQPTIPSTPNCTTVNQQTTCECAAIGYPEPDIYWTKYGSDVIIHNGSTLTLPSTLANDGTYICHAANPGGTVTSPVTIAVYGSLMTEWTPWSGCNNSCGSGHMFRSRLCNQPTCFDILVDWTACVGDCIGKPIPILAEVEDPYVAVYVLAPLAAVAAVAAVVWLARIPGAGPESVIIPAKGAVASNAPIGIGGNAMGVSNPGYEMLDDMESIEVNLDFDDDVDTPDNFDGVDDNDIPPSPVESFTMDTPSVHSENFYEELETLN